MDLNAWASAEIHLYFMNVRFLASIKPYSFQPFDVSVKTDPVSPSRWCHGADFSGKALKFEIDYQQEVNECHWGLFGQLFLDNSNLDCTWRYYKPEKPLFETQITEAVDFEGSYYNYRCMNWHSAEWDQWPLTDDQVSQAL